MEERPVESATIAGPSVTPKHHASRTVDPLETDIVQILAKIKGKVSFHILHKILPADE